MLDAGDPARPVRIQSGCTYEVLLPHGAGSQAALDGTEEAVHLVLERGAADERLTYRWDYEGTSAVSLFSWHSQPFITDAGQEYDFYWWPGSPSEEISWNLDPVEGRDVYHVRPGGEAYQEEPHVGDLFITLSSKVSNSEVRGEVAFTFEAPKSYIQAEQLEALKDVFYSCCSSSQQNIPARWTWRAHMEMSGDDPDEKPYCDWLFGGWQGPPEVANATEAREEDLKDEDFEFLGGWSRADGQEFGEDDCEKIDGVRCDGNGNVVELALSEKGLKCQLPGSLNKLTALERLYLDRNQLEGPLPQILKESDALKEIDVSHNFFEGNLDCPRSARVTEFDVSHNFLTGGVPACLGGMRALKFFRAGSNRLRGELPPELGKLGGLVTLNLEQNEHEGPIPQAWKGLGDLTFLSLGLNRLSGPLDEDLVNSWTKLYQLDLSYNNLNGTVPFFGKELSNLRHLSLSNNEFAGQITGQLDNFQKFQDSEVASSLDVSANRLSGLLPRVLYKLVAGGGEKVKGTISFSGNKFLCESSTGSWPDWALRLVVEPSVLGVCTPLPTVAGVVPNEAPAGAELLVQGEGFAPSPDLRCKFAGKTGAPAKVVPAPFVNETTVLCAVPDGLELGEPVALAVANFGDDWSDGAKDLNYSDPWVEGSVQFWPNDGRVQSSAFEIGSSNFTVDSYCFLGV